MAGLVRLDLLQVLDDPQRRGGRLVCVTERGRELALDAYESLIGLEGRLDADTVTALRELLEKIPPPAG